MENASKPLIIAHRGASSEAPENTLAAFDLAWQEHTDAIECDLHLSADKRIMVCHDPDTRRVTGHPLTIAESTSNDLRSLDAGSWKHSRYTGERIPFFEEVLTTVPQGKDVFIELKTDGELPRILRDLLPTDAEKWATLIGFDPDVLRNARRVFPGFRILWLLEKNLHTRLNSQSGRSSIISKACDEGFDGLDIRHKDITSRLADEVHAAGLDLIAWTVNDELSVTQVMAFNVSGITTDRPGWLRSVLDGMTMR